MMWVEFYFACGIVWWLAMVKFKEHAEAWKNMNSFFGQGLYALVELVLVAMWPLSFLAWCVVKALKIPQEAIDRRADEIAKKIEESAKK